MKKNKYLKIFTLASSFALVLGFSLFNISAAADYNIKSSADGGIFQFSTLTYNFNVTGQENSVQESWVFQSNDYILGGVTFENVTPIYSDDSDITFVVSFQSGLTAYDMQELINLRTNKRFTQVSCVTSENVTYQFNLVQSGNFYDFSLSGTVPEGELVIDRLIVSYASTLSVFREIKIADKRYNPNLDYIYEEDTENSSSSSSSSSSEIPEQPDIPVSYPSIFTDSLFVYELSSINNSIIINSSDRAYLPNYDIINGFSFNNVWQSIIDAYGGSYQYIKIKIIFSKSIPYELMHFICNYNFPILTDFENDENVFLTGNDLDVTQFMLQSSNNGGIFGGSSQYIPGQEVYSHVSTGTIYGSTVKIFNLYSGIEFRYIPLFRLEDFYIRDGNTPYDIGFQEGIIEGGIIAEAKGWQDGYDYAKKLFENQDFGLTNFVYNLFDMPGRIIGNGLNFDFLGINIADMIFFVLTTLLISYGVKHLIL